MWQPFLSFSGCSWEFSSAGSPTWIGECHAPTSFSCDDDRGEYSLWCLGRTDRAWVGIFKWLMRQRKLHCPGKAPGSQLSMGNRPSLALLFHSDIEIKMLGVRSSMVACHDYVFLAGKWSQCHVKSLVCRVPLWISARAAPLLHPIPTLLQVVLPNQPGVCWPGCPWMPWSHPGPALTWWLLARQLSFQPSDTGCALSRWGLAAPMGS